MQLRRTSPLLLLLLVAAIFAAACSAPKAEDTTIIEVFGPYRGEDAKGFAAAVAPFEEATGYDVLYIGTGTFSKDIQKRVDVADYPDVALFPQPALIRQYAEDGLLQPLNENSVSQQMANINDVLAGTIGDTQYAVWFRGVVKSLVWYPPAVFAERGYAVPKTWDDLMNLTAQMRSDGTAPWCLTMESFGATGWVGTDWIEDIVLRTEGDDYYDRWVSGQVTFEDDGIVAALDTFSDIVHTPDNVYGGIHRILNEPWQNAQTPMFDAPPNCLLNKQASFQVTNLPPDVTIGEDTDVFLLPSIDGTPPPILASGDLAAAFSDRPEVMELMTYLESPEAGRPWAERGGFVSPHPSFNPDWYADPFDRRMGSILQNADLIRFDGSDLMIPSVGTGTFWTGMVDLVRDGDAPKVAAQIQAGFPQKAQLPSIPVEEG